MQQTPIQELIEKLDKSLLTEKNVANAPYNTYHELDVMQARIIVNTTQSIINKLTSLLHTEQQYTQQHAEGFAEWVGTNVYACDYSIGNDVSWTLHDGVDSNIYTTSELYTKYIEYINSLK